MYDYYVEEGDADIERWDHETYWFICGCSLVGLHRAIKKTNFGVR